MIKEFETALTYVQEHYVDLFGPTLESIKLVPARLMPYNCAGQCWTTFDDGLTHITIRRGQRTVMGYVGTIVHELTHFQQHATGRRPHMTVEQAEAEADRAGWDARVEILMQA